MSMIKPGGHSWQDEVYGEMNERMPKGSAASFEEVEQLKKQLADARDEIDALKKRIQKLEAVPRQWTGR